MTKRPSYRPIVTEYPVNHNFTIPELQGRIKVAEAARSLGVTATTIRNWIAAGKISAIRTSAKTTWVSTIELLRLVEKSYRNEEG